MVLQRQRWLKDVPKIGALREDVKDANSKDKDTKDKLDVFLMLINVDSPRTSIRSLGDPIANLRSDQDLRMRYMLGSGSDLPLRLSNLQQLSLRGFRAICRVGHALCNFFLLTLASVYTSYNTLPKSGQQHTGESATHRVKRQHTQCVLSSQCVAC